LNAALLSVLLLAGALEDEDLFVVGQEMYADFDMVQAQLRFEELLAQPGRSAPDQAKLWVWIGLCLSGSGESGAATDAWTEALRLDLEVQMPDVASPKVKEQLEVMRAEATERAQPKASAPPPTGEPAPPPVDDAAVAAPAPAPAPAPSPEPQPPPPTSEGMSLPLFAISGASVATVGIGVGVGSLVTWLSSRQFLDAARDTRRFQSDAAQALGTAETLATTSLVLGISAGVLVVGGAGLALADLFE
jgi:hypothetical protein